MHAISDPTTADTSSGDGPTERESTGRADPFRPYSARSGVLPAPLRYDQTWSEEEDAALLAIPTPASFRDLARLAHRQERSVEGTSARRMKLLAIPSHREEGRPLPRYDQTWSREEDAALLAIPTPASFRDLVRLAHRLERSVEGTSVRRMRLLAIRPTERTAGDDS